MAQLVFILGRSGTGKSYSMRNFPKDKFAVINVQGKVLPFKGAGKIETTPTDESTKIIKALEIYSKQYKSIVIDDYQYTMANEFMRRSTERGYDKFTDIGRHAWDIANKVRELPDDVIVYILCHTDRDDEGNEKIKTIGKLLDEKICLEGMSTIVLKTNVTDGVYSFLTQNNGKDTVKSPAGMFPSYAIENDLYYVDQKIRNYYELGEFLSDEDIKEIDEAAKKDDIPIDDGKKKRRKKTDESAPASAKTSDPEPEKTAEEPEELPKRKSRSKKSAETASDEPESSQNEPEEPAKQNTRRRRKAQQDEPTHDTEDTTGVPEEVQPEAGEKAEKAIRRRRRKANEA